jgi:ATP-dependent Clp protease ATP-binding subunit ClpC
MFTRFNDAARLVLRLADLEAQSFHHDSVGTEHLLLALVQLHHCVAARVLAKGNIFHIRLRTVVESRISPGPSDSTCERRPLTPGAQKAIEYALAAAERLGHAEVGTGHLLLGLLEEAEGVAYQVLCERKIVRLGKNLSRIAERVLAEMSRGYK